MWLQSFPHLKLKENMRGIRYSDLEDFEAAVATQVRVYECGCLAMSIEDLPKRWTSVMEYKGYYFEGF